MFGLMTFLSIASSSVRYSLMETGSLWLFSLRKKSISTLPFYPLEVGVDLGYFRALAVVLPDGERQRRHRQYQQGTRNRPGKEQPGIRVGHDGADQVDLDLVAEDHPEDEGCEREAELHHRVADQAEHQQHVDVRHGIAERVSTDRAQHQHHR